MDVIANIDRTIDGVKRKAGERFTLPDDSDLVAKGVVRDASLPSVATPDVPGEYPPGFQGLRRKPSDAPAAASDPDPRDPLDHDGDGHKGGSLPSPVSTASKGRRKRA